MDVIVVRCCVECALCLKQIWMDGGRDGWRKLLFVTFLVVMNSVVHMVTVALCCVIQEAFDYIGSSRMVYDMKDRFMNFTVDDIEMFIEIGQIGLHSSPDDAKLWLHSGLNESQMVIAVNCCCAVCVTHLCSSVEFFVLSLSC